MNPPIAKPLRVLVADDEHHMRVVIGAVMRQAGYAVDCAEDAADAARLLHERSYDLLLVDIDMPGNRHLEFVRRLSLDEDAPPIIIITGRPTLTSAVEALRLSVFDYVDKPIATDDLLERARRVIAKGNEAKALAGARAQLKALSGSVRAIEVALTGGASSEPASETPRGLSDEQMRALSERERNVVEELAQGKSTAQIGASLFISPYTVRNHLKSIYRKLEVKSRSDLLQLLLAPRSG